MRCVQRIGVGLAMLVVAVVGPVTGARAQANPSADATGPGAGFLVAGIALAAGGGALQYYSVHRFTDSIDDSNGYSANPGWIMLSSVGTLVTQVGGALTAAWGWKLGEHDLRMDLAAGAPIKERRSLGLIGFGVGVIVVAGILVGQVFVLNKAVECGFGSTSSSSAELEVCAADAMKWTTIVQLAGSAVLLGVAPMAGYGFGYDSAADRAVPGRRAGLSGLSVLPAFLASGTGSGLMGLRLTGHF